MATCPSQNNTVHGFLSLQGQYNAWLPVPPRTIQCMVTCSSKDMLHGYLPLQGHDFTQAKLLVPQRQYLTDAIGHV